MASFLLMVGFPVLMAFAAFMDLLTMTIPNRLSLALVLGYFTLAAWLGFSWLDVGSAASCAVVVFVLSAVMFHLGWIGGGDAKLASASALWVGWAQLLNYGLAASIIGGVVTLALMILRARPVPALVRSFDFMSRLMSPDEGVPYGIALALGGLVVYPHTQVWAALAGGVWPVR